MLVSFVELSNKNTTKPAIILSGMPAKWLMLKTKALMLI
jgi:hypothetical protein